MKFKEKGCNNMKKAIVTAGSRGIGKAISDSLKEICDEVISPSSSELDTSNLRQVDEFISKNPVTDILVMNTGGPPAKEFSDITKNDWNKYHNQLFLSFCIMLQKIHINNGGYIFLMSSFNIKEPDPKLILCIEIFIANCVSSTSTEVAARSVTLDNVNFFFIIDQR